MALAIERGFEYTPATTDSDPAFLERIAVNYLRHVLSNYEKELAHVYGRMGVRQAYKEISRKVYDAISKGYPWLEEECRRQLKSKMGEP